MVVSVAEQCRACITTLKSIISILSDPQRRKGPVQFEEVTDELERFSLWIGNIGALHPPASSMSLESRLREVEDVQTHILELLRDINDVAHECGSSFLSLLEQCDLSQWLISLSVDNRVRRAGRGGGLYTI